MDERLDGLEQERAEFADQCETVNQGLDARFDQVRLPSPASVHEDSWMSEYACDTSHGYVHTVLLPWCDRPRLSCEPSGQPMQVKLTCVEVSCIQVAEEEERAKKMKAEAEEQAQSMRAEREAEVENSKRMAARIGQSPF